MLAETDEAGSERQEDEAENVRDQRSRGAGRTAGGNGVVDQTAHQQRRREVEDAGGDDDRPGENRRTAIGPEAA